MERIPTGIEGLDEILKGGVLPASSTLIGGAPGTGKTTLGIQFIYNGALKYGQSGIIVTFEEFPEQLYRDAMSFGWDLKALEEQGKLKIIFTSPEIFKAEMEKSGGMIDFFIRDIQCKRILIDSVSLFKRITTNPSALREIYNSLINGLKREQITGFLTYEIQDLFGEMKVLDTRIPFIVDNIIFLRYVEIESEVQKALIVLKTRGSDHDKDIRQYEITDRGLTVHSKFEGREGLMTGNTRKMIVDKFVKAFQK